MKGTFFFIPALGSVVATGQLQSPIHSSLNNLDGQTACDNYCQESVNRVSFVTSDESQVALDACRNGCISVAGEDQKTTTSDVVSFLDDITEELDHNDDASLQLIHLRKCIVLCKDWSCRLQCYVDATSRGNGEGSPKEGEDGRDDKKDSDHENGNESSSDGENHATVSSLDASSMSSSPGLSSTTRSSEITATPASSEAVTTPEMTLSYGEIPEKTGAAANDFITARQEGSQANPATVPWRVSISTRTLAANRTLAWMVPTSTVAPRGESLTDCFRPCFCGWIGGAPCGPQRLTTSRCAVATQTLYGPQTTETCYSDVVLGSGPTNRPDCQPPVKGGHRNAACSNFASLFRSTAGKSTFGLWMLIAGIMLV